MCGRYGIDDERDSAELRRIIDEVNRRVVVEPIKTSGEVFPADLAPVVANNRQLKSAAFAMRWGYTTPDGRRVINARSETAEIRPMFRDGMRQRRCAVPATCYYEWERSGRARTKYAVRPTDAGLFYMAGLYRIESDGPVFTILTRDPAESIAFIHDRMPVILPHELVKDWTNPRFSAGDILAHAVLDVAFAPEQTEEQMKLSL